MVQYDNTRKRIEAAGALLDKPTISRASFESVSTLIKGINPKIDSLLSSCSKHLATIDKIQKGEVVTLVVEQLPENTEEEKKRKKALLLFLQSWSQLKGEVKRVQKELANADKQGNFAQSNISAWGRIAGFAKGPLGIITLVAVGVVALKSQMVTITVKNIGCPSLNLALLPFSIPGLSLPKEPIAAGSAGKVSLPPLSFVVDAKSPTTLKVTILGFNYSFAFAGKDLSYNGESVLGTATTVNLGSRKEHEVVVKCK